MRGLTKTGLKTVKFLAGLLRGEEPKTGLKTVKFLALRFHCFCTAFALLLHCFCTTITTIAAIVAGLGATSLRDICQIKFAKAIIKCMHLRQTGPSRGKQVLSEMRSLKSPPTILPQSSHNPPTTLSHNILTQSSHNPHNLHTIFTQSSHNLHTIPDGSLHLRRTLTTSPVTYVITPVPNWWLRMLSSTER